jgi:uncharacterized membrane protein
MVMAGVDEQLTQQERTAQRRLTEQQLKQMEETERLKKIRQSLKAVTGTLTFSVLVMLMMKMIVMTLRYSLR